MYRHVGQLWSPVYKMALTAMNLTARLVVSSLASFVVPVIDVISRKEERALTAEIENWIVERVILYIVFSYPKSYPASKPCPERVVFKEIGRASCRERV